MKKFLGLFKIRTNNKNSRGNENESKEEQIKELSTEHPVLRDLAVAGLDCDYLPSAKGDFGHVSSNSIPVNGLRGTFKYINRLRCKCGVGLLFHRIATTKEEAIEGYNVVDLYETVCLEGKHWDVLFLHFIHPRRSTLAPQGYYFADFHPIFSKLTLAYGTNQHDNTFPFGLGKFIEEQFKMIPLRQKYEKIIKDKGKFVKPKEHEAMLNEIILNIRLKNKVSAENN